MKAVCISLFLLMGLSAYAGTVGLPLEHISLPAVTGEYFICIWNDDANDWHNEFIPYDGSGSLRFQVPEWDKWYWVGIWDEKEGTYIFGKWIGHFKVKSTI